jgi:hypothetical protein
VRVFSVTLLVEQRWSQLISFCPPTKHPRVNPFTRSEDESVSKVLGLGGATLVGGVTDGIRADLVCGL